MGAVVSAEWLTRSMRTALSVFLGSELTFVPVYTVRLRINVPSLGERPVDFPNITAPTIEAAIEEAKKAVIVEPIAAQKTAE
jgi:hypothetical protein